MFFMQMQYAFNANAKSNICSNIYRQEKKLHSNNILLV